MGCGVTTPRSGHIEYRPRHYWIFIKTMVLFPLRLWLIFPPPLIVETCSLLFLRYNGLRESHPLLLCHYKVKYWPHGDILCRTNVMLGDINPNRSYPHILQSFTNWGVLPSSVPIPRHLTRNQLRHPIMQTPQILNYAGGDNIWIWPKEKHRLNQQQVKPPIGSSVSTLS